MWSHLLSDLTEEQIIRGIKSFCLTQKEIYDKTNICAYIREFGLKNPNQQTAGEAWKDVLSKIGSVGSYGIPKFDNVYTQKAVDCVGWKNICVSENVGVERAHFFRVYEELIKREQFNAKIGEGADL